MQTFMEACLALYEDCLRLLTYIIHSITATLQFVAIQVYAFSRDAVIQMTPTVINYYGRFVHKMREIGNKLNEYEEVKAFVFGLKTAHGFVHEYRVEPLQPYWICISYISDKKNTNPLMNNNSYRELYDFLPEFTTRKPVLSESIMVDRVKDWIHSFDNDPKVDTYLLTCKYNDTYTHLLNAYHTCHRNISFLHTKQSNIKFLSIEYVNEVTDHKVVITLHKGEYMVGNNILSAEFLNRYFEYNGEGHLFVMDYTVKIMDSNISNIELKNDEYITLLEHSYLVNKK